MAFEAVKKAISTNAMSGADRIANTTSLLMRVKAD